MRNNKGFTLLMALAMISILAGLIMICAFALSHEVNNDERYDITRQRMLEVKRSLIGRLADASGGDNITSCGGFISDYGKPYDDLGKFDMAELLSRQSPPWNGGPADIWRYDTLYKFWGGYRGDVYVNPPPGETEYRDGWGHVIEVEIPAASPDSMRIISRGSDRLPDSGGETGYEYDIIDTFDWQRGVHVPVENIPNGTNITVQLVYPDKGDVQVEPESWISDGSTPHDFTFPGKKFPVGLRKIRILEGAVVKKSKVFCLPPGSGPYTVEPMDYSG
jgi:hypothetical protein